MRKQGQNGLARARKRPNLVAASRIAKQRCVGYWNRHLFSVALASNQNWRIIPRHPLANDNIQLMDYAAGFQAIDWEVMNLRDYHDLHSKSICMAT